MISDIKYKDVNAADEVCYGLKLKTCNHYLCVSVKCFRDVAWRKQGHSTVFKGQETEQIANNALQDGRHSVTQPLYRF